MLELASAASSASVKPWTSRAELVLVGEPREEQQRVVGAERDGGSRIDQRAQRDVRARLVHAEVDVRCRADLERDAARDELLQQRRVLGRTDAVAEPGRAEGVHDPAYVLRAGQLATVRHTRESCPARDRERVRPLLGDARVLVVRQPERDDFSEAVSRMTRREAGERLRLHRVTHPRGGDDDAHAQPVRVAGVPRLVHDDLQRLDEPADMEGVRARVDLELESSRPFADIVGHGSLHDPAHGFLARDDEARGLVRALEPVPAPRRRRDRQGFRVEQVIGERDVRQLGELAQRGHVQRSGEVEVEMGLR